MVLPSAAARNGSCGLVLAPPAALRHEPHPHAPPEAVVVAGSVRMRQIGATDGGSSPTTRPYRGQTSWRFAQSACSCATLAAA